MKRHLPLHDLPEKGSVYRLFNNIFPFRWKKEENIMSRNAGNAKIAYETATDQGEKWREKSR